MYYIIICCRSNNNTQFYFHNNTIITRAISITCLGALHKGTALYLKHSSST